MVASRKDTSPRVAQDWASFGAPTALPAEQALGILGVIRRIVEDVNLEMAGRREKAVLDVLMARLDKALPGITLNENAVRSRARDIHRRR